MRSKKNIFLIFTLLSLLYIVANLFEPKVQEPVSIIIHTSDKDEKSTIEHFRALIQMCPNLKKFIGDFDRVDSERYNYVYDYLKEDFGWTYFIEFKIKVKDSPEFIPRHYRANGHTLYYLVNLKDEKAGAVIKKDVSQNLCIEDSADPKGADIYVSLDGKVGYR